MRQRYYRARVWLDEQEYNHFIKNVEKTGLSKEIYLRQLIIGYHPKERPPLDYFEIIRKLTMIGSNMNQIAAKLNATSFFDEKQYSYQYEKLKSVLLNIQRSIESSD